MASQTPARRAPRHSAGRAPASRKSVAPAPTGRVETFLADAARFLRKPAQGCTPVRFGVDLGTATIVLTALDATGQPVYWDFERATVVRDGVVVDFQGAVKTVSALKARAESLLGVVIGEAAAAHPPAVPASDCRACQFVLQQAGIDCRALVDEVSAANALLQVRDGAVVDVGGGSTGVGLFRGGKRVSLSDRPGGGHHLDLIVAGALGLSVEEAEEHKRMHGAEVALLLRPGIERIAESIRRQCGAVLPQTVYLSGGALRLPQADAVISRYLGWPVQAYDHAELITPFGIALS